ncbi:MAG: type II toxin-antitoxin system RelE/ParE family toxin, partial [Betaproteobacteria bacterium]
MRAIRYAENFGANLEAIHEFLLTRDVSSASARLTALLADIEHLAELIAEQPMLGRAATFLSDRGPRVTAARRAVESLQGRAKVELLREYTLGEYWVLYAVQADAVVFLAVRSAKQQG